MVTISDSSLRANVFETLHDALTGISAWGLSSSNTVTVTAAFISDDEAFPQVVLHPIEVSSDPANYDRSLMDREIRVLIEVFSKRAKDLDQMSDKIFATIETLSTPGMMLVDTDENNAMGSPANLKIHSKAISLTYRRMS